MSEPINEKIIDFKRTSLMKFYEEILSKVSPEVMNLLHQEERLGVGRPIQQIADSITDQVKDDLNSSTEI